jgi:hypothetical protein
LTPRTAVLAVWWLVRWFGALQSAPDYELLGDADE